jgi:TonB family protein
VSAAALLVAVLAVQTAPLAPATKWAIDYADAKCALSRTFGTAPDQLVLGIVAVPEQSFVELIIVQPGVAIEHARRSPMLLRSPASATVQKDNGIVAPLKEGGRVSRMSLTRPQLDALRVTPWAELTIDGKPWSFALSGLDSALKALAACEADLLREWGADPEALARVKTKATPAGSPASWVTDSDYPGGALSRGEEGTAGFRLFIDATGAVRGCAIISSSGSSELDDSVCTNIRRRARFNPARDADGKTVASVWMSRFTWRIPH